MSALDRIRSACGVLDHREVATRDATTPCFEVPVDGLEEFLRRLRDECGFETNTFVTAIDHHPKEPRFEVDYQFLSYEHNDRVRVRTHVATEDPTVPTITHLWPGASFSERECFDMFGIVFEGHPDLRRLLMPEGYDHYPLRKDFPHHGIEPDRLYREWERGRR